MSGWRGRGMRAIAEAQRRKRVREAKRKALAFAPYNVTTSRCLMLTKQRRRKANRVARRSRAMNRSR